MLTAFGVDHALAGTFFEDVHLGLHLAHPASPSNELAGFGYVRRESPAWLAQDDGHYRMGGEVSWPLAQGTWPPVVSLGFWRHAAPAGLLGSARMNPVLLVRRDERLLLSVATIMGAVEDAMAQTGAAGPALRALREGAAAAVGRLAWASLHAVAPAEAANELRGTPGLAAAYADHAAGRPIAVTDDLTGTLGALLRGDRVAAGYGRVPVPGWEPVPEDSAAYRITAPMTWPALPLYEVLQWQYGGRGVVFPRPGDDRWPVPVAVGFSETPSGPIQAWTSAFAGRGLSAGRAGRRSYRVVDLRLTLYDRSRIAPVVV